MPLINCFRRFTAVGLAVVCVLVLFASASAQTEETLKVDTELINLEVVVMDRQGQRVGGLGKEEFTVYEDGKSQEVSYFTTVESPLKLILLFDLSLSMEEILPVVKREAIELLRHLRPDDRVIIISFASDVRPRSDWLEPERAQEIIRGLNAQPHPTPLPASIARHGYNISDGNTFLYEAFQHVFERNNAAGERLATVVFSDGVDTGAGRSTAQIKKRADEIGSEVRRQAEESWVQMYAVRYQTTQFIGALPEAARRPLPALRIGRRPSDTGRELFARIAAATGGNVFEWTTQAELVTAIQQALADLRSRYNLAYRPPRTSALGQYHTIKVRVKRPGLIVQTRDGYRTPAKF